MVSKFDGTITNNRYMMDDICDGDWYVSTVYLLNSLISLVFIIFLMYLLFKHYLEKYKRRNLRRLTVPNNETRMQTDIVDVEADAESINSVSSDIEFIDKNNKEHSLKKAEINNIPEGEIIDIEE